ncbi:MAG: CRTAC1 family protein [Holophagales bacterium]|nr:CRTAC1 family protein [Holophagales bacterium]MYG31299.1 CRTAC1 family protein [Holophagales bacterium]MYI78893.1 CRTAC1 family protein [Holophagales bacterium]
MRGLALAAAAAALLGCAAEDGSSEVPAQPSADVSAVSGVRFVDVTAETGLDFVHASGSAGTFPMPAIMGGGVAAFDANGDGLLDLYFPNAGREIAGEAGRNRFYVQRPRGRFVDATAGSGLDNPGYGMGAAVGDIDNDGDLDLYVTNLGADVLYRNEGGGRFAGVTEEFGVATSGWSTSAVFFDADLDGWLDLYVAHYVQWHEARECQVQGGRVDYCGPQQFEGEADVFYRNDGGRHFVDRSREAGVSLIEDAGLGVVAADLDADGLADVYVANDADPNQLWINRGNGMFEDDAVLLGAAYNRFGVGEAGMGIALGDIDGDRDLDLFLSHLIEETNTLYLNLGGTPGATDGFEDRAAEAGLAAPSTPYTGFGTAFFDADNDGDLDLAVVNGAVKRRPEVLSDRDDWFWRGYAEPNLLMLGDGAGVFADASAASGDFGTALDVSRGLVPFDLEGDGDLDLLVSNLEGSARIYRNETIAGPAPAAGTGAGWVRLRVIDPELRRTALGASVVAWVDGRPLRRLVLQLGGYLTGGEAPLHIGLGDATAVERFEVTWPGGAVETFEGAASGSEVTLLRGEGR